MNFFSLLKITIFNLLAISNHCNAHAIMDFTPSGMIHLHFNGNNYLFESINHLSENINEIMNGCCIVDNIYYDVLHNNKIVFQGVRNTNDLHTLVLRGDKDIVLHCNNGVFTFYNILLDNNVEFEIIADGNGICKIKGLNNINGNYINGGIMKMEDLYEGI